MNGAAKAASVDKADSRLAGGESNAARGGDSDAQSREAAGSGGDGDAVKIGEVELCALQDTRDQWHQCLGMSALHRQRFLHADIGVRGVEHGDRTGFERGIDGQDAHAPSVALKFRYNRAGAGHPRLSRSVRR